ncbi:PadR family transcriptional regulator [Nocardioides sp.]|uniref:PadR family transcriptional regulator n=1 Tax=Nocardioides sp. TaxID=35761 RepID=UPI003527DC6F
MALEHALLVALSERPAAGLDLARRFERSIGFFWHATHQQIYRVLARMEADGWLDREFVEQSDRPTKKVYAVSEQGRRVLADWLATPTPLEPLRSDLAVKMRGASRGDREAVLAVVRGNLADHRTRLAHYDQLAARDYPVPAELSGQDLDSYLVLRGGIRLEEFWIGWLEEYLLAYADTPSDHPVPEGAR